MIIVDMVDTRICTRCRAEKPLTEFHRHRRGKYGRNAECASCAQNRITKYYLKRALAGMVGEIPSLGVPSRQDVGNFSIVAA
jgi:hypothetical protein